MTKWYSKRQNTMETSINTYGSELDGSMMRIESALGCRYKLGMLGYESHKLQLSLLTMSQL